MGEKLSYTSYYIWDKDSRSFTCKVCKEVWAETDVERGQFGWRHFLVEHLMSHLFINKITISEVGSPHHGYSLAEL